MKFIALLILLLLPLFAKAQLTPAQLWKAAEPVGNTQIKGPSVLVDKSDNVFMITTQTNLNPLVGFSLVKYDSLGEKKWLQRYSPLLPNIYGDGSYVVDKEGNVHVGITTGGSWPGIQNNFVLLKYDTYSTLIWEEKFGESEFNSDNVITHLAVDTLGHLYALGYTADPDPDYNWLFIFCFDISYEYGAIKLWRTDIPGVHYTQGFRLLSDRIEALSTEYRPDGKHFVISQVDFDGNAIQSNSKPYSSPFLLDFNHISDDGSVVFGNRGLGHRAVKVNVQGDTIWDYNLPPILSDQGLNVRSIAEDDSNYTYITGSWNQPLSYLDIVTTKLNETGEVVWQKIFAQEDSLADVSFEVVTDNKFVYITGSCENPVTRKAEALVLIYDNVNGENLAEIKLGHNFENTGIDLQLLTDGFILACISNGDVTNPVDSTEIVTYRFRLPKSSNTQEVNNRDHLEIYPNPAHDFCFATQDVGMPYKRLSLFDLSGREVKSQPFLHLIEQVDVTGLPQGQYILKANGEGASAVSKIVIAH